MLLFKLLVSWYYGIRIDDIRYIQGSPFVIGTWIHFKPQEIWTKSDWELLRYHLYKQQWNGFKWEFVGSVQVSNEELISILKKQITLC